MIHFFTDIHDEIIAHKTCELTMVLLFQFIAWDTIDYHQTPNSNNFIMPIYLCPWGSIIDIYILYARWAKIDWKTMNQIWNICNETKLPKSRMQSSTNPKTNNNFVQLF